MRRQERLLPFHPDCVISCGGSAWAERLCLNAWWQDGLPALMPALPDRRRVGGGVTAPVIAELR